MRETLTVLQQAVLSRLRTEGYAALANAAGRAWSRASACPLLQDEISEGELRTEYEKANAEANSSESRSVDRGR